MRKQWVIIRAFVVVAITATAALGSEQSPAEVTSTATASQPSSSPTTASAPALMLTPAELEELLQLITTNNTIEARELGARKLLQSGSRAMVARLADVLKNSTDPLAKLAVCRAIAQFERPPEVLIDPVLSLLGDASSGLGESVVLALRRFDSSVIVERTLSITTNPSRSLDKRMAAINVLGRTGDELQAVAALIQLVQNDSPTIRDAALEALSRATGVRQANPAAAVDWWKSRESLTPLQWLREVNERRITEIGRLREERDVLSTRLVAAYRESYLQTAEAERPQKLLTFLTDPAKEARRLGLDLVNALITDRKDVGQEIKNRLIDMIHDPDAGIRSAAAVMVGDLRVGGALSKLVEALSHESEYSVRVAQISALGRLDDSKAVDVLMERLRDDVPEVVGEAAQALSRIARRGNSDVRLIAEVANALLASVDRLPAANDELCEKFLDAMGRIGSEKFRDFIVRNMRADRSLRIRRAAINALGQFEDTASADAIRQYVSAAEPEIRLAAVSALGRAGRRATDLSAVGGRLDSSVEGNQGVRDKAWESYVAIIQRLTPEAQLEAALTFDQADDKLSQRRQLQVLKSLKTDQGRFASLSADSQIRVLDTMADAQLHLEEYDSAVVTIEQAISAIPDNRGWRNKGLAVRLMSALLRSHQDETAVKRLKDFKQASKHDNQYDPELSPVVEGLLSELDQRVDSAATAQHFTSLNKLMDALTPLLAEVGEPYAKQLANLQSEVLKRRDSVVERLLERLGIDADADAKLMAFDSSLVLRTIYATLTDIPSTSAPASDNEMKLVEFAKKIKPEWVGYNVDSDAQIKTSALHQLKGLISAQTSKPTPRTNTMSAKISEP